MVALMQQSPPPPASSPSSHLQPAREQLSPAKEARLRAGGAELIQRAGILLKLPQVAVISGAAIFQRFYCKASFSDVEAPAGAAGALLLACKLEEHHRRLRDIVTVFFRLQMREVKQDGVALYAGRPAPFLDHSSTDYIDLKGEILRAERHILKELGFAVALLLEHPHKFVLPFVTSLFGKDVREQIAKKAWAFLNDAMRTNLCSTRKPHELAAASIFLAARVIGIKMPSNPPWWVILDTDLEDLHMMAQRIQSLYREGTAEHFRHKLVRHASALMPLASPSADELVALAMDSQLNSGSDGDTLTFKRAASCQSEVETIEDSPPEDAKRRRLSDADATTRAA